MGIGIVSRTLKELVFGNVDNGVADLLTIDASQVILFGDIFANTSCANSKTDCCFQTVSTLRKNLVGAVKFQRDDFFSTSTIGNNDCFLTGNIHGVGGKICDSLFCVSNAFAQTRSVILTNVSPNSFDFIVDKSSFRFTDSSADSGIDTSCRKTICVSNDILFTSFDFEFNGIIGNDNSLAIAFHKGREVELNCFVVTFGEADFVVNQSADTLQIRIQRTVYPILCCVKLTRKVLCGIDTNSCSHSLILLCGFTKPFWIVLKVSNRLF